MPYSENQKQVELKLTLMLMLGSLLAGKATTF